GDGGGRGGFGRDGGDAGHGGGKIRGRRDRSEAYLFPFPDAVQDRGSAGGIQAEGGAVCRGELSFAVTTLPLVTSSAVTRLASQLRNPLLDPGGMARGSSPGWSSYTHENKLNIEEPMV